MIKRLTEGGSRSTTVQGPVLRSDSDSWQDEVQPGPFPKWLPQVGQLILLLFRSIEDMLFQGLLLAVAADSNWFSVYFPDATIEVYNVLDERLGMIVQISDIFDDPFMFNPDAVLRFSSLPLDTDFGSLCARGDSMLSTVLGERLRGGAAKRRITGKTHPALTGFASGLPVADGEDEELIPDKGAETPILLKPGEKWVVVYPGRTLECGAVVPDVHISHGGYLGVVFDKGESLPVVRMSSDEAETFKDRWKRIEADEIDDLRTTAVMYDSQGERFRRFEDSLPLLSEAAFADWPLTGDRNVLYRLKVMVKKSQTPVTQHIKWVESSRINKGDRSRYEHECLAKVLDAAVTYDQLNVANLLCMEKLVRRQMVLEAAYKESEVGSYEGAEYIMGEDEQPADGSIIRPSAQKYQAEKMKEKFAIQKERRKAAEERNLKKGGKGGQKGEAS